MTLAKLTALEAVWGGLTATLSPGFLVLLPVFLAFIFGSLRHELIGAPKARQQRDVLVSVFFFAVGFNSIFIIVNLTAVMGHAAVVGADTLAVRAMTAGIVGLWGIRQFMGLRVQIGDDSSRARLGLDDWPVAALVGLVIGAALALGWQDISGPVLGTVLGLQMYEGAQHGAGFMMAMYGIGLSLGMLTVGALCVPFLRFLSFRPRALRLCEAGCGVVLVGVAVGMVMGAAPQLTGWLLVHLPVLNRLG